VELNEQTTTEELEEVADQLFEADQNETNEDDSLNEDSELTSDDTSDDDAAGGDGLNEEDSGDSDEEWLDDELKSQASDYGLDEEDLSEFDDRDQLERHLAIIQKRALRAVNVRGKNEEASSEDKAEIASDFNIELDAEEFPEEIVDHFTRMRDHYESKLSALEQRVQLAEEQFSSASREAEEGRFDDEIDKLEMSKFFGTTGNESQVQMQRREEVMELATALQKVLEQQNGRNVKLSNLVRRVAPAAFPDEFDKQKHKERTRKITKQSNRRMGGSQTRATETRESDRDHFERLYRELDGQT